MASTNKTAYYQLNSWIGTDPVKREDFNADNEKLDAALAEQGAEIARLKGGLQNQQYNTYALMLTNHYDGRYTGMKRALIVQAMNDYAEVESLTNCALDVGEGYAKTGVLTGEAISTINNASNQHVDDVMRGLNQPAYQHFELKGPLQLTGFQAVVHYTYSNTYTVGQKAELYAADQNGAPTGTALASAVQNYTVSTVAYKPTVTFQLSASVDLQPGKYVLKIFYTSFSGSDMAQLPMIGLGALNSYSRACTAEGKELDFAYQLALTGNAKTVESATGTLIMRPVDVLCSYDKVYGYFRHDGHTPAVELSADDGISWHEMTVGETVTLIGPDGRSSYETSYEMEDAPVSEDREIKVRIGLNRGAGTNALLYDYGVVFL